VLVDLRLGAKLIGSTHASVQAEDIMPIAKLKAFLDANNVKYTTVTHSTAYTAQEIASLVHIKGQNLAKTVIIKVNGEMAMAVLPAHRQVNLLLLAAAARTNTAALATEPEFRDLFPGCETGAMPPFGNLYGMRVYVEESLTKDKEISFNAGTHNELIRLSYQDFERLVRPTAVGFAYKAAA